MNKISTTQDFYVPNEPHTDDLTVQHKVFYVKNTKTHTQKDHIWKIAVNIRSIWSSWFQRKRMKCKKFTDRQRTGQ